ncbi:uncharacterized protein LOC111025234 [Momordica charantia]|uniref:Uncharacterized protein LOC111025234 n=1 Tax=Momordica charantia TaxID=3673 RepID=A0A6J1DX14_MOMCH|nr:uncharacterized protein LOC111025234 [Momordica charantia]
MDHPPNPPIQPKLKVERVQGDVAGGHALTPPLNAILLGDDIEQEIRAYAAPAFFDFNPVIVDPIIEADRFELKPAMFQMLQIFHGLASEDPYRHLQYFMQVANSSKVEEFVIDASSNKALLLKHYAEAFDILEEISRNKHQRSKSRAVSSTTSKGLANDDVVANLNSKISKLADIGMKSISHSDAGASKAKVNSMQNVSCPYCKREHHFEDCPGNPPSVFYLGNPQPNMGNNQQAAPKHPETMTLEDMFKAYMAKNETYMMKNDTTIQSLAASLGNIDMKTLTHVDPNVPAIHNVLNPEDESEVDRTSITMIVRKTMTNITKLVNSSEQIVEPQGNTSEEVNPIFRTVNVGSFVPKEYTPMPPYPKRLQKRNQDTQFRKFLDVMKQLRINIPLVEALKQMPTYVRFLKDILTKKHRLDEFDMVCLTKECSTILSSKILEKMKYPGSFTIPIAIGDQKIGQALCDREQASI